MSIFEDNFAKDFHLKWKIQFLVFICYCPIVIAYEILCVYVCMRRNRFGKNESVYNFGSHQYHIDRIKWPVKSTRGKTSRKIKSRNPTKIGKKGANEHNTNQISRNKYSTSHGTIGKEIDQKCTATICTATDANAPEKKLRRAKEPKYRSIY